MGGIPVMQEANPVGRWHSAAPRWIFIFLGAYLTVRLLATYLWSAAGQNLGIQCAPDSTAAMPVTAMAGVGLWLCLAVLRGFPAGAPLRPVWLLITLAAAAQAVSGVVAVFLGSEWLLNPLVWAGYGQPGLTGHIRLAALIAAGPIRLVILAAAVPVVLRVLGRFGFWGRPNATEWAAGAVFCLFALRRFAEAVAALHAGRSIGVEDWSSLAGLPLLCVLFIEAIWLRQAVVCMGHGPVAKCWNALVWGVILTASAELALWLIPHYSGAPLAIFESCARLLTAGVFTLAPAYQLSAQRLATKSAPAVSEDLVTALPAVAR
jgi:hypothetical protein